MMLPWPSDLYRNMPQEFKSDWQWTTNLRVTSLFLVSVPLKVPFLYYEHCVHVLRSVYVLIWNGWEHSMRAGAKLACIASLFSMWLCFDVYHQVYRKFLRLCHTLCEVEDDQKSFSQASAYIQGSSIIKYSNKIIKTQSIKCKKKKLNTHYLIPVEVWTIL